MEKIKDYFNRYPHNDEVFETGGVLFHNRGAAESYGKETPVRYTRAKVMAETVNSEQSSVNSEELELQKAADELKAKEESDAAKEKATEVLKTSEVIMLDYQAMKVLAKDLQLVTADQKKETLIAALTEFKNTLTVE